MIRTAAESTADPTREDTAVPTLDRERVLDLIHLPALVLLDRVHALPPDPAPIPDLALPSDLVPIADLAPPPDKEHKCSKFSFFISFLCSFLFCSK